MSPPRVSFGVGRRSRAWVLLLVAARQGVGDFVDLVLDRGLGLVRLALVLQALVVRQAACRLLQAAFAFIDVLVSHADPSWFIGLR